MIAFLVSGKMPLALLVVWSLVLLPVAVQGQTNNPSRRAPKFQVSLSYWQGVAYGGKVQVRENEHVGTPFDLKKDLGIHRWIAPSGRFFYQPSNRHRFDLGYTLHSFTGSKTLRKDAWYNGTHLQSNSVVNIGQSSFYRLEVGWQYQLLQTRRTRIGIRPAIVYDHLIFWVDAPFYADTPRKETFEKFSKQQLPLPNLGFTFEQQLGNNTTLKATSLSASLSGTYLPKIRTWMQEGGNMYLQQENLEATLGLAHRLRNTSLSAGYQFRYFALREESQEDTNDITLHGSGLFIGVAQAF